MSARIQTTVLPRTNYVAGRASVTFYVNIFQDPVTKAIEQGNKTFRKKANAERKGRETAGRLRYLGAKEVTHEVTL